MTEIFNETESFILIITPPAVSICGFILGYIIGKLKGKDELMNEIETRLKLK